MTPAEISAHIESGVGMLKHLSTDEKALYVRLRSRGTSRKGTTDLLYEAFPDAYKYSKQAFKLWEETATSDFRPALNLASKGLEKEVLEGGFSLKHNRLTTRFAVTTALVEKFAEEDAKEDDWDARVLTTLSREIRENLNGIMTEVDGLGLGDQIQDLAHNLQAAMQKLSPETQKRIGVSAPQFGMEKTGTEN